ncbi:hypothetical protein PR048_007690 [Dryococelus australis]|uniref:Uncharacterized protein n=1 Tax=Dryococelus australis TaxID=614101 RepID=A0ABQ9HWL5_9NEOP|nr:hypothetical protein PR048_007690 [Dryococelus australis]
MRVKQAEYGTAPERKDGGNGRTPRKPADQRHRPVRFPDCKIRGATHRRESNLVRLGGRRVCDENTALPVQSLALSGDGALDARDSAALIASALLGLKPVSLLASHLCDPGSIPGRVTPDFCMWESCRTMTLVCLFSQRSPVSQPFNFGAAPHSPQSPSSARKTSMIRAAQISSLCWAQRLTDSYSVKNKWGRIRPCPIRWYQSIPFAWCSVGKSRKTEIKLVGPAVEPATSRMRDQWRTNGSSLHLFRNANAPATLLHVLGHVTCAPRRLGISNLKRDDCFSLGERECHVAIAATRTPAAVNQERRPGRVLRKANKTRLETAWRSERGYVGNEGKNYDCHYGDGSISQPPVDWNRAWGTVTVGIGYRASQVVFRYLCNARNAQTIRNSGRYTGWCGTRHGISRPVRSDFVPGLVIGHVLLFVAAVAWYVCWQYSDKVAVYDESERITAGHSNARTTRRRVGEPFTRGLAGEAKWMQSVPIKDALIKRAARRGACEECATTFHDSYRRENFALDASLPSSIFGPRPLVAIYLPPSPFFFPSEV